MTQWRHFHFSLSCIGEGNGNPLQCSCLENPRDRGAWWTAIYGVTLSRTRLKWLSSSGWVTEKAKEFQKNICFIDYTKTFDCVDHNKLWKILREKGMLDHLNHFLRTCMQVKKQQLEMDMEQRTGSKLGKKYVKAIHCHPAYLTSTQSTSWETLGWMKHSWNQDCWEKFQ